MNYGDDQNPYAPPTPNADYNFKSSYGGDEVQLLAEPGDRFLARLVDGLFVLALMIPWIIFLSAMDWLSLGEFKKSSFAALKLVPAELPIAIYQWMLVARTGQTIGKKMMRIRIVRTDGGPVGFGDGVALRDWVMRAVGFIPCVGGLISLVGILMIFGQERRCLHDRIAGTKVIKTLEG